MFEAVQRTKPAYLAIVCTACSRDIYSISLWGGGRRLHNSVVQRGRRGQVVRVKTRGGSEFLPLHKCFGMKRKHGLLPDHIAFSAASTHPDRSAPKLGGWWSASRPIIMFKKRCFYLMETKCTVDVCAAPCGP